MDEANVLLSYSPGGVDLQINGALGVSFNDLHPGDQGKLRAICDFLWQEGVDAFLPTLVTTSLAHLHRSMSVLAEFMDGQGDRPDSATVGGIHLEGPFLHPQKRGAHPPQHLLPLDPDRVKEVVGDFGAYIRLITLAPELDTTGQCLALLQNQGIKLSMGHTTATLEDAQQSIARGISMVTHGFNAMPSLHHRQPGLLGEVLRNDAIWCGVIADGIHLHPGVLDILYRLKKDKLFLVSDALAPYGLPEGSYPWDDRFIEVRGGTARLADSTLAGTTRSLLAGVIRLVEWGVCSLTEAIALVTHSPRQALGATFPPKFPLVWWRTTSGEISYHRMNHPGDGIGNSTNVIPHKM